MVRAMHLAALAALLPECTAVQQFERKKAGVQRHHRGENHASDAPLGASLSKALPTLSQDAEWASQQADGGAADLLARRREQAEFRTRVLGHVADPKMEACLGKVDCKLPMCRWLELTRNEDEGKCPLFERELMACAGWKPVEAREDATPMKVDCVVDILRRTDVVSKRVRSGVDELQQCMDTLVGIFPDTRCDVAFGLVHDAIADYKFREALQANLTDVRAELRREIPIAEAAVSKRGQNEGEVAKVLQGIVDRAESMPGAVMVDEIRKANDLLHELVPVPAARQTMEEGLERSEAAFNHGDLQSIEEAMAWMEIAVAESERFHVGDPEGKAQQTLEKLRTLSSAMKQLDAADLSANVSLVARTDIDASIAKLEQSIQQSEAAGLEAPGLVPARALLQQLTAIRDALDKVRRANAAAAAARSESGDKGLKNVEAVRQALNSSIADAYGLGLAAKPEVTEAVGNLDWMDWLWNARQALHRANLLGQKALSKDSHNISDDEEEAIMSYLTPALAWAEELHFRNGMGEAKRLYELLGKEESAKEGMSHALAQANASLVARSSVEKAIEMLEQATASEAVVRDAGAAQGKEASLVAGRQLAQEMLEKLRALQAARGRLQEAERNLNASLATAAGLHQAGNHLNRSIRVARRNGLDEEAEVAEDKLEYFNQYLAAKQKLMTSLAQQAPKRPDVVAEVRDREAKKQLIREGLEPKDLGPVEGAEDDFDDDFDEHVNVLRAAIEAGRQQGYVDPKQQAQLARALAIREAHAKLLRAEALGQEALATKANVQDAVIAMSGAIADVSELGIHDDVADAKFVLEQLKPIEPARTELERAMLQASIAFQTEADLGDSWRRLTDALAHNVELNITDGREAGEELLQRVMVKKEAVVNLKAAMIHGDIALQTKSEEELAMQELETSLAQARAANLTRKLPDAENLLEQLLHMHLQEQTLEETMRPHGAGGDSD